MKEVTVIILSHNQLEFSKKCLLSLQKNTDYPYHIIWVDNASTDGTVEWLRGFPGIELIVSKKNLGFARAVNLALNKVNLGDSHILMLNNDTVLSQGWLSRMANILNSNSEIGGVGPVTCHCASRTQKIEIPSSKLKLNVDDFAIKRWQELGSKVSAVDTLIGFCALYRAEAVKAVGLLDERFYMSGEDLDYSRRVRHKGYKLLCALGVYVHHFGHVTANKQTTFDCNREWARGVSEYRKKWGVSREQPKLAPKYRKHPVGRQISNSKKQKFGIK